MRVGKQVAIIAARGLLKRPSGITAQAAQFDGAAIALRAIEPPTD